MTVLQLLLDERQFFEPVRPTRRCCLRYVVTIHQARYLLLQDLLKSKPAANTGGSQA